MKKLLLAFLVSYSAHAAPLFLENLATGSLEKIEFTKPTVIVFIQPSCIPCKIQLEALQCLKSDVGDKIQFLAVQANGDSEELMRGLRRLKLGFPILKGTSKFLASYEADVSGTPMTVFIEKGGKVKERILGAQPCIYWKNKKWEGK